jgi:phosphopantothenoylcysteine decarboxylase / phosphopantothenate---cysteine ligase
MKNPQPPSEAAADRLHDKCVVLCVTGGIAAYKSAILVRALVKAGARVIVIMTEAAQRFVAPLTFETLSGNPVVTSTFDSVHEMGAVEHIELATWADFVIVAPATYNFLGKLAAGIADDPVTTFISAVTVPVFIAPAMNDHMWRNPICQRNVAGLRQLGYRFVDPQRGGLACSWVGEGRMSEPETILNDVRAVLGVAGGAPAGTAARSGIPAAGAEQPNVPKSGTGRAPEGSSDAAPGRGSGLAGQTLLVTAGSTREAIDPVRFVANRSTGRMGYALAAAGVRRGARVLLVSGPSELAVPEGLAAFHRVESAEEMQQVCREWLAQADVLLMAAAVADFRPRSASSSKIKRAAGGMQLDLEPTPDLLTELRAQKGSRFFVGFALETGDPARSAQEKLRAKGLDLVVANRVGPETGPGPSTNQVWIFGPRGLLTETPLLDKGAIAEIILDAVESASAGRTQPARA